MLYILRFSSAVSGTASSAAADGVGARRSAAKSQIVKSVSCPTADITGTRLAAIVRASVSSLNAHKSSIEPPPRPIIIMSTRSAVLNICIPVMSDAAASSPCTSDG